MNVKAKAKQWKIVEKKNRLAVHGISVSAVQFAEDMEEVARHETPGSSRVAMDVHQMATTPDGKWISNNNAV